MNFLDAMDTSGTGLSAQRLRMNLISSNLANIRTTRTPQGGPYRRKDAVFSAEPVTGSFGDDLKNALRSGMSHVNVTSIEEDRRAPIIKHIPGHPDADENGNVAMPNINVVEEMVNMISATRGYEANITAIRATKNMALKALEIGR